MRSGIKAAFRLLLSAGMIFAGVMHFLTTDDFARIVPAYLPAHRLLVQISGVFEIAFGAGLLHSATRRWSGWGLVALYVAVFPANINMAVLNMPIHGRHYPALLWLRLPLQFALVAWALWVSKPGKPRPRADGITTA